VELRPYQAQLKQDIYEAWDSGARNVLGVLPTGGGKTIIFSDIIKEHKGPACVIAHRKELVSQISLSLARCEVPHRIIGPENLVRMIVRVHMAELGDNYYHASAPVAVAGVDTLVRRLDPLASWLASVGLVITDESHHLLFNNKWGDSALAFPNAKNLGVTATPLRADGCGLGSHADGIYDKMVIGPNMRDLINMGYLSDYRIFAPPSNLDLTDVNIGASGDYSRQGLSKAIQRSEIMGDVVHHYLRIAPGKLGITFAVDVETATDIAKRFNRVGVPAQVVSANTPHLERVKIMRDFKSGFIKELVNVDLFTEGFDLPALELVSMARPTESYSLYCQQFGRVLRIMDGKESGIIIDHVGNVMRHGLPDAPRIWTLDRRQRRARRWEDDELKLRTCVECTGVFDIAVKTCPYCGKVDVPASRSDPRFVDGDLTELSPDILAQMRNTIADDINAPIDEHMLQMLGKIKVKKRAIRQHHLAEVREAIEWWGGYQRAAGVADSVAYRRFYHRFGVDVSTAQTLDTEQAKILALRITGDLGK